MIETQRTHGEPSPAAFRRRGWLTALAAAMVALVGIGVGFALANRDETPNQAIASERQRAMLNQACADWLGNEPTANTPATWCDDMTAWMNRQIADGSMNHQMMWSNPDQMRTTCRAWTSENPSAEFPAHWCDTAVTGMRQHMNNDWDHRSDWDNWKNDHPGMGG